MTEPCTSETPHFYLLVAETVRRDSLITFYYDRSARKREYISSIIAHHHDDDASNFYDHQPKTYKCDNSNELTSPVVGR